jgi:serine protease Do
MNKKQYLIIVAIAFFVGGIGSIFLSRYFVPFIATFPGLSSLNKLQNNAPIVINRREEVQLNEGVNLIELSKQAQSATVTIYSGVQPNYKFAGTGLIISSDGLIFTTKDVIANQTQVKVVLNDGTSFDGAVRATDPKSELAMLTIPATNLPVTQFADAGALQIAQRVFSLGRGEHEFTRKFASGFVTKILNSNVSLEKVNSSENFEESIETDMNLKNDFVGAPLVNLQGQVVGIVVNANGKILVSEDINPALKVYLDKGKVTRSYLGLKYLSLSKSLATLKNLPDGGASVVSVEKGSPAEKGGLVSGDLITQVDGQAVADSSLERLLNAHSVSEMKLTVLRQNETKQLTVNLVER